MLVLGGWGVAAAMAGMLAGMTAGMAAMATANPAADGGRWPSRRASGPMYRNPASAPISVATATTSMRFRNHPSCPGRSTVERHANAFAACPRTTAVNAAPEAVVSAAPVGNA